MANLVLALNYCGLLFGNEPSSLCVGRPIRGLRFNVNTDGKITTNEEVTNTNSFRSSRRNSFNTALRQWLSDTCPDV